MKGILGLVVSFLLLLAALELGPKAIRVADHWLDAHDVKPIDGGVR